MNQIIRSPQGMPAFGERNGDWIWNGVTWVCSPCSDQGPPGPPCPPPGFPPPGCPPWWSGANSPPWYPGANAGVSFGTSPPPNPVRGHFWWNGTTLYMFDGAVWEVVGGGAAPGGTPPQPNPPTSPTPGEQWFDGTTLWIWDGNAWVPVSQTKTYVQATAPPAPNPGDLWYDGSVMRVWSGSSWQLVGPGAFTGPVGTSTNVFSMAQTSNITIPISTFTALPFTGTPMVDTMNGYDPVTHRYTPKKAGMYLVECRGIETSAVTGIAIVKNDTGTFNGVNSDIVPAVSSFGSVSSSGWIQAMGWVQMNGTTDYLRFWFYSANGLFLNTGSNPCFGVLLLP